MCCLLVRLQALLFCLFMIEIWMPEDLLFGKCYTLSDLFGFGLLIFVLFGAFVFFCSLGLCVRYCGLLLLLLWFTFGIVILIYDCPVVDCVLIGGLTC